MFSGVGEQFAGVSLAPQAAAAPAPAPALAPAARAAPPARQDSLPVPPDEMIDCITMEIMTDPVMAMDGQSYERSSIEAWFAEGKRTSPKTNAALDSVNLIPNLALKTMIQDWRERHPVTAS